MTDADEIVAYRFGRRIVRAAEAAGHDGGTPITLADLRLIPGGYASRGEYVRATGDYGDTGLDSCPICDCPKGCVAEEPNSREPICCADDRCPCHAE